MTYRQLAWLVFLLGGVWGVVGFAFDLAGQWLCLTLMVLANMIRERGDRRLRQMEYLRRTEELASEMEAGGRVRILTAYLR